MVDAIAAATERFYWMLQAARWRACGGASRKKLDGTIEW